MKKILVVLIAGLMTIGSVSPSFAGSGTDGVIEISWKDLTKSKAKKCGLRQKITFNQNPSFSWAGFNRLRVTANWYNGDDERIGFAAANFSEGNLKTSDSMILSGGCSDSKFPGPGPYYFEVKWETGYGPGARDLPKTGQFEVPYKFKKK
jgi:hypothetical protein